MKIITVSREFGSGGRELGKRLAEHLQFDYYDGEILQGIAEKCKLSPDYVSKNLEGDGWQSFPITFRHSFQSGLYYQNTQVDLLLSQKKVLEEIALLGRDCVIVGRNANCILKEHSPFNLFVCADLEQD